MDVQRRVSKLKSWTRKNGQWGRFYCEEFKTNPYRARYGAERWVEELDKAIYKQGVSNVTVLMKHVKNEGDRLFADTRFHSSWVVYHDALSAWWSKDAQEYFKSVCTYINQPKYTKDFFISHSEKELHKYIESYWELFLKVR